FENLDVQQEINNKISQMIEDGSFANIIAKVSNTAINVVALGVDNTGETNIYEKLNNIINENDGRTLYFPEGLYKINTTILIRNDSGKVGVKIWADHSAKFITDGVDIMFRFGNDTHATGIVKIRIEGGVFDCSNINSECVKFGNNEYSGYVKNSVFINAGDRRAHV